MRIFQLNTFCGVKSTGRIACEIAKLVSQEGGECIIGYGVPGISPDSQQYAYQIGTKLERKLHAVLRKLFDAEGYGSILATWKLIRYLRSYQPELIHLHNLHGCYLHIPMLFSYFQKLDIPIVWTLHDCWPFTGHCAYFDYSGCERWKTGCHHCPQQKSYPICIGLDGSKRNYKMKHKYFPALKNLTLVTPCKWLTKHLRNSFLAEHEVRVIENGVNLDVFYPVNSKLRESYGLQNQKICLAVAAEWDHRKGLSYLFEAAKKMGDSYTFVIIGLSDTQIATLPPNIIGIRKTADTQELAAWYSTADCLVNPTLEDNMPMVNLESLACGTPVVAFDTGGCPEALDATSGVIVAKGSIDELCAAIEAVTESGAYLPEDCTRRAQKFESKQAFQRYLALYKELIQ